MRIHKVSSHPSVASSGTAVVFVHGAWHGEWCWSEQFLPYFAEHGYPAHAFDLRGHGQSDGATTLRRNRIADYVADLKSVVDGLGGSPVLIGHSMGGVVVQKYLETELLPAPSCWRHCHRSVAFPPRRGWLGGTRWPCSRCSRRGRCVP